MLFKAISHVNICHSSSLHPKRSSRLVQRSCTCSSHSFSPTASKNVISTYGVQNGKHKQKKRNTLAHSKQKRKKPLPPQCNASARVRRVRQNRPTPPNRIHQRAKHNGLKCHYDGFINYVNAFGLFSYHCRYALSYVSLFYFLLCPSSDPE